MTENATPAIPPVKLAFFSLRCEEETVSGYLDKFGSFELKQGVDYAGPEDLLEWIRRRQLPHLEFSDLTKFVAVEFIAPPSASDAPELPDADEEGTAPAPDTPPLTPVSEFLGG